MIKQRADMLSEMCILSTKMLKYLLIGVENWDLITLQTKFQVLERVALKLILLPVLSMVIV